MLATVIFSRAMRKKVPCVVEIRNSADDRSGTAAGLYQLRVFAHWSVLTYHVSERAPQGFCTGPGYKRRPKITPCISCTMHNTQSFLQ